MPDTIIDDKYLDRRILKAFRHLPLNELPDAPVHALKGLSEGDGELLNKSFYVKTVRDLADLKYILWAQDLVLLSKTPQSKIDMSLLKDILIKKYETMPVKKILQSPVSALQGLSAPDKTRLGKAFNVKTVSELARLKYGKWAQEICAGADGAVSSAVAAAAVVAPTASQGNLDFGSAGSSADLKESPGQSWFRTLLLILLVAAILFAIYWFFKGCDRDSQAPDSTGTVTEAPVITEKPAEPEPEKPAEPETTGTNATDADKSGDATGQGTGIAVPNAGGDIQPGSNYAVRRGDTLYGLSRRAYGTERQWRKIYEANRALISNPDLLVTGRSLKIP